MMTDDRAKALRLQKPEKIPVTVSFLPAAWIRHRERLAELVGQFACLFERSPVPDDFDGVSLDYEIGVRTDAWGCRWQNLEKGMIGQVVPPHPVPRRELVHQLRLPVQNDGFPHGFMFLRLFDLRGFDEMMLDFADEPPELELLIDKVLQYNLRQLEETIPPNRTGLPDYLGFGDDLGWQNSLPIRSTQWRRYLKPAFKRFFADCRTRNYYVYLHTDGYIREIVDDLFECGVNVLNSQVCVNGLEEMRRLCQGRICLDADLDRQRLPFWSADQIDEHVFTLVKTLGTPAGGLWLTAHIGPELELEGIKAILAALKKYRYYFS